VIVTIWIALALFVAGEYEPGTSRRLPAARLLFLLGALICVAHITLAMSNVHRWSHAAAIAATAAQTNAFYGVRWGGGVYVNYVFSAVWIADALQRLVAPASFARRSRALVWTLRAFYFVIIVNAAVIFAAPGRRWMGVVICVLIAVAWSRQQEHT
jgi:hypothetical protein